MGNEIKRDKEHTPLKMTDEEKEKLRNGDVDAVKIEDENRIYTFTEAEKDE